jgi:hypothetical protein
MNYTRKNFGNADPLQERESSFFVPDLNARAKMNDLYTRLRDNPKDADLKDKIKKIWNEYKLIAPNNFLKNAQRDFHQHWWEMYLSVGLLHLSKISSFGVETHIQRFDFLDRVILMLAILGYNYNFYYLYKLIFSTGQPHTFCQGSSDDLRSPKKSTGCKILKYKLLN